MLVAAPAAGLLGVSAPTLVAAAGAVQASKDEGNQVAAQLDAQGGATQPADLAANQVDKALAAMGFGESDRAAIRAWLTGQPVPPGARSLDELRAALTARSPTLVQQLDAIARQQPAPMLAIDCGCGCGGNCSTTGSPGGFPWLAVLALLCALGGAFFLR